MMGAHPMSKYIYGNMIQFKYNISSFYESSCSLRSRRLLRVGRDGPFLPAKVATEGVGVAPIPLSQLSLFRRVPATGVLRLL